MIRQNITEKDGHSLHVFFLSSYIMDIYNVKGDEKMIGILAGMGPKSTGPFTDTVVAECQTIYGAKHDIDFPHMMIYSCPTPFYMDHPIDHEAMNKAIIEGAQKLESTGVDFIADFYILHSVTASLNYL